ncbi:MAG: hypothetical protein KF910_00060 [Brevundimonas sp.]|uniref:M56 family metallopeptidase n=1 Tax=Brevundimonas sp. TaxID=1871086 RepID=UPI0025BAA5E1|nr:M56 family metallopeptidase [Brevundimonas sp.]MBX3475982.1 hypothetical protein [Brevundimonas sp.]
MIALLTGLLCKSIVVAGLTLALVALMRGRPAAERVIVLRAGLLVLLALPLVALFGPDIAARLPASTPALLAPSASAAPAVATPAVAHAVLPLPSATLRADIVLPGPDSLVLAAWILGAALIVARLVLGLGLLAAWSRRGTPVGHAAWIETLGRLAPRRAPRLRLSRAVQSPLSWGLPPGEILIGPAQLAAPAQAEAVLAHELEHIRRADWAFLMLARLVAALCWINPLAWLMGRELERLSEQAVDEAVVRRIDRESYARVLVGLAAQAASSRHPLTPAWAAARMTGPARTLSERIDIVMSAKPPRPARLWIAGGAVAALAAVATPIAALELHRASQDIPATPSAVVVAQAAADEASQDVESARGSVMILSNPSNGERWDIRQRRAYNLDTGESRALSDQEIQDVEQARHAAEQARATAEAARGLAEQARNDAMRHVEAARLDRSAARVETRRAIQEAMAAAREAQAEGMRAAREAHIEAARAGIDAARIRREAAQEAARAVAAARIDMAFGSEQMIEAAATMRQEADRLSDPAYRAEQIERDRARGHTVTEQQLLDAIPKLRNSADRMEAQAARLRDRANRSS